MISMLYISREIFERILFNVTALDDLFERKSRTSYNSGDFLLSITKREAEIKQNLKDRVAITQVSSRWRTFGMRYRCEFLLVDAKSAEVWKHIDETLESLALGKYVKCLHFDGFNSCNLRVKNAIRILQKCSNIKHLSIAFSDDCRNSSPIADLFLYTIRSVSGPVIEHMEYNFGKSFAQASIIRTMGHFPNLRRLHIHSAYGVDSTLGSKPLDLAKLQCLELTSTKDTSLGYMSNCTLPALVDMSIFQIHSVTGGNRRFFVMHGSKLRSLELAYVVQDIL